VKKPKRLTINRDELTLAQLAGELVVPLKITIKPSPIRKLRATKVRRKRKRHGVQSNGHGLFGRTMTEDISPMDALTRFDVTIEGQTLDMQIKQTYKNLVVQNIHGIVEEAKHQMDWAIRGRIKELKMKMYWEETFKVDISKL
jgi:hypothetical protein